jgi:hypothetical protein
MEADIKMCEELLAQDSFGVKGTLVMTREAGALRVSATNAL